MRILITSSSLLSAKGTHHLRLEEHEILEFPGPLRSNELLKVLHDIDHLDGYVCGDDEIILPVILRLKELKIDLISKYGVGLDKIDLKQAENHGIEVRNCAGVNSRTVAEHTLSMLLFWAKAYQSNVVEKGFNSWTRSISRDIRGLKMVIIGMGNVGSEFADLSLNLGMEVSYFDPAVSCEKIQRISSLREISKAEVISIHAPLNKNTHGMINQTLLKDFQGVILNTSRASIISEPALIDWLNSHKENTLITDVLYEEPPKPNHWMLNHRQVVITPHVGSRSFECIERQANMALDNLGL